ncbi:hypothetical protein QQP08_021755 [Theobroma cacao]|nr:hypothetical protein QQP08_021755 [Theobroma cacao]
MLPFIIPWTVVIITTIKCDFESGKEAKEGWSYIFQLFVYDQKKYVLTIQVDLRLLFGQQEKRGAQELSMPPLLAPLINSFNHIHSKSIPKLSCHWGQTQ